MNTFIYAFGNQLGGQEAQCACGRWGALAINGSATRIQVMPALRYIAAVVGLESAASLPWRNSPLRCEMRHPEARVA